MEEWEKQVSDDEARERGEASREWWGLRPPEGYEGPAWGARAIYKLETETKKTTVRTRRATRRTHQRVTSKLVARVELLWDRQSTRGDAVNLCEWVEAHGLPEVRKMCVEQYLTGDSAEILTFSEDYGGAQYAISASPRESCGYLYLCAWEVRS